MIVESPSADLISIEKMVSQKSASGTWVSVYPPQAKGSTCTRGTSFAEHGGRRNDGSMSGGGGLYWSMDWGAVLMGENATEAGGGSQDLAHSGIPRAACRAELDFRLIQH